MDKTPLYAACAGQLLYVQFIYGILTSKMLGRAYMV